MGIYFENGWLNAVKEFAKNIGSNESNMAAQVASV